MSLFRRSESDHLDGIQLKRDLSRFMWRTGIRAVTKSTFMNHGKTGAARRNDTENALVTQSKPGISLILHELRDKEA
jgi:hypothetical protein